MGGKTGTTTSQVSIPPEVLARYNSVNAQAQQVAATPFQPYTGQFVAGLTPTQQAGIQATSQYSQAAQPYFQAATGQLAQGQGAGQQAVQQAFGALGQGVNVGQQYGQAAGEYYGGAAGAAMPYYGAMQQGIGGALSYAQPMNVAAQQAAAAAPSAAAPYYGAATAGTAEAVAAAQPYQEAARQGLGAALQYSGGINQMAPQLAYSSYGATQPIMGQALAGTEAAQRAGAPFQRASTQAALAGAQGISPEALNIGAYMSPYTQSVADTTYQAHRQQQQQEMAGQTANAIRSGAFGGDRAALAAANLARQQQLGTAQALAPIYQQGFGQALAAAQQQQGVGLSAAQANRAAMQNLAAQLQGIGQQGYAQQLGAAGQIGQLGQNIYGQGLGTAQALSQLGQTGFGQQLQAAQAQAALGQQAYGQQIGAAQQFGNLGQNIYGMGANQANLLSQLGQTGYGQQLGAAQQYGNIGQNLYTMGMGTGQALQGLGQQQYGQGLGAAQQLGALGQQQYGMGTGTAQQLAALGTGAQQAALQGAQAQLGAGTLEQQTQQADLTAQYQQFLQQRGYPFQVAQFLANIAMGTGALSGSTTTTTQPMPFFSDRRVKHDVKEIGKTHDGQPIFSFKYNGHNDTQIGLMAQDVEKKHPEAVGEYGGVKTVDYKKATEGAERKERYAGGIVPESQGGAVTDGSVLERRGYALNGAVVDPNDISSILAMQQQALGPFGQMGLYGQGHAEGQPYGQSGGIVPKTRLHVASLKPAEHRTQQLQGLGGQALEAYDTGKKLYGGYQEAKGLWDKLGSSGSAALGQGGIGSDAVAAAAADKGKDFLSMFGFAEGGVVPRKHFVQGGTAFSDPYKPYDIGEGQVPEEVLDIEDKPELAKAPTPSSGGGSGSGLGTALALGKTILGFLPFKDGGIVSRHGYATDGIVSPLDISEEKDFGQTVNGGLSGEPLPPLPRGRGVMPEPNTPEALRFFTQSKAQEYGLDPDFAVKVFEGESGFRPHVAGDEGSSFNVPQLHYGKVSEKYPHPGLGDEFTRQTGLDARDPKNARAAIDWSLKYVSEDPSRWKNWTVAKNLMRGERPSEGGVMPSETAAVAASPASGSTGGIGEFLRQNQSWMVPLGAGLRGMVQSKSPFLGGALLEGVGTGLEAVGPAQKQIQDLAEAQARIATGMGALKREDLIWEIDPVTGRMTARIKPEFFAGQLAKPKLEETQKKVIETGKQAVGAPTEPTVQPEPSVKPKAEGAAAPIQSTVINGQYKYDINPSSSADQLFAPYGYTGDPNDATVVPANLFARMPNLVGVAEEQQKLAAPRLEAANNSDQIRLDNNMLTDAVMGISETGPSSRGPGQPSRARLVNIFNWAVKNAGLPEKEIDVGSDITDAQIIAKLQSSSGVRQAGAAGFHAGYLAQAINEAQPSGELTEEASRKLLSSMAIQNQINEDFARYYNKYVQKYGTALYVDQNFKKDMGQYYDNAKAKLAEAYIPVKMPDGSYMSPIQYLRKNPSYAPVFEQNIGVPGLARTVLGG